MKIGIAQIDCELGDVQANRGTIRKSVEQAANAGCDVVVLPEMADTGYDMGVIQAHASPLDRGPCRALCQLAADAGIAVICGLSERSGKRVYNAAAIIDESGHLVARYRKAHLFTLEPVCEDRYLGRGDALVVAELAGFKIGIMICYDIRFPEMARALALEGAELLVVVAAWPAPRIEHWNTLIAARAVENQVYLAASNRVGQDGKMVFGGNSRLLDPFGREIARGGEPAPTLLIGEIDRDRIARVRAHMRLFDDRRPELYGRIVSP